MIVAPIEAIIAQQKPKKFILSNEGPNTKKRPAKVDKKRLLTNLDIFSLSTTIEYNNTCTIFKSISSFCYYFLLLCCN